MTTDTELKLTPEEIEAHQKDLCDLTVQRAAEIMVSEVKAPVQMLLDRLFTFTVAQAVSSYGRDEAVRMLELGVQRIKEGMFDAIPTEADTVN